MNRMKKWGSDPVLLAILLLAAFLYGYGIWDDKYGNLFYTSAVGSMLQSWHNFFYGSLDSAGSVTVDKPPVVFWIQTLFAWVFGLHGWSVILPQTLAGVGSSLLVYVLVKPGFGRTAARVGALAMALTPVVAAVARTNNIDAMLVFTLLLATWFLFRGTKTNRLGSLLAAFGLIGVAFNEKMLQAYMVLPAFYLFYLLAAKVAWKKKAGMLAASTAVLLAVSLSWPVIVDSIPADKRPYIGSSGTNSVLNLAFGYNGVARLTGDRSAGSGGFGFGGSEGGGAPQMPGGEWSFPGGEAGQMPPMNGGGQSGAPGDSSGGDGGRQGAAAAGGDMAGPEAAGGSMAGSGQGGQGGQAAPGGRSAQGSQGADSAGGGRGGFADRSGDDGRPSGGGQGGRGFGGGGMFNTGTAGPLRLFQQELSGQASWLIPFVLFGCVGIFSGLRRRNFTDKHKEAIFWLAWLVPVMVFFSIAGFFHQYYLIMMAPPVAALAGAGFAEMLRLYRERSNWLAWLLPAAVLATAAFEWYILQAYNDTIGRGWSIGALAAGIAAAVLLAAVKLTRGGAKPIARAAAILGLLILFIGPAYWALTPITYGGNSMTPAAGPDGGGMGGGRGRAGAFPSGLAGGGNAPGELPGSGNMELPNQPGGSGGFGRNAAESVNESLVAYLKEHNDGQEYLFAAMNYSTGGPYIVAGEKVVILNGFSSSDVVYTTDTLAALVKSGKVKYFLVSSGGMGGGREGSSGLTSWITEHGTEVPSSEWAGSGSAGGTLYEVTAD